jgi:secondary thiamine-phosphate synthase enzyme
MGQTVWIQREVVLKPKRRGFHLVSDELLSQLPELEDIECGVLHCFLQHTSASLSLNENADPTVRVDMEAYYSRIAPEREPYYQHTLEGDDDMPAHLKTSLIGCEVTLPVTAGRLNVGTWQGLYLGEHRDDGGRRRIILTLQGLSLA